MAGYEIPYRWRLSGGVTKKAEPESSRIASAIDALDGGGRHPQIAWKLVCRRLGC